MTITPHRPSIPAPAGSGAPAPTGLAGIHHVGLTVRDVERSAAWYEQALGLERAFTEPHHGSGEGGYSVVLVTADLALALGLDHHPGNDGSGFDATRTGLDHVSLRVHTAAALDDWAAHLTAHGVDHSGVYRMEATPFLLLTFRDPDGIQLELLAIED